MAGRETGFRAIFPFDAASFIMLSGSVAHAGDSDSWFCLAACCERSQFPTDPPSCNLSLDDSTELS